MTTMAGNTVYVQGNYVDVHDNEVVNLNIDKATVRVQENAETAEDEGQETVLNPLDTNNRDRDEKLCLFVHPSIDDEQSWQIHDEIKRLVARQGVQEICQYLLQMSKDRKILLPQSPTVAYDELVRLGMPNGEKYNIKTFSKYYQK